MEIWVDGPRATDKSWRVASKTPVFSLPVLTEEEKEQARVSHWSEEDFARSKFAGETGAQEWAERMQPLAVLLQALLKESNPQAVLQCLLLETLRGRYHAVANIVEHEFWFEIREEVVDDLCSRRGKLKRCMVCGVSQQLRFFRTLQS